MIIISYLLSFSLLWGKLRQSFGHLYAIAYSYTIIFSLTVLNVVICQILTGKIHHVFIALLTLSMSLLLVFKLKSGDNTIRGTSPYTVATACVLCLLVVYAYGFNSVRFYDQRGRSIPVVGTNDDNANHMALATASIKDSSMIISSVLMQKMVDDHTVIPATKWYPFGLYSNMNVGYDIFRSILGISDNFEIRSFFSFNTIFTVGLLLNLLVLFYALVDRIYKVRTIHTFALSVTVGFAVILDEFFIKLQLFGFHSQLASYCAFIALLLTLDTANKEKKLSLSLLFLICLFIFAVGTTYYLFIPLAGLAYLIFHTESIKDWRRIIPYAALAASGIPLLLYNASYSIKEQSSAYGIAFVGFTGLMTAAVGILISILMRKEVNEWLRRLLILQFGLNIVMMILGTIAMYSKTGNFGYYFFKSYWTMGILGLPLLAASIGYVGDVFITKHFTSRVTMTILAIIISGGIVYAIFSQAGFDSRGYDLLMMVHNGNYNYPFDQKKWIRTYEKYKNTNGKNIYSIGMWGQVNLARAIFEDSPELLRSKPYLNSSMGGIEKNIMVYRHIIKRLSEKTATVLLDIPYQVIIYNNENKNAEEKKLFETSLYHE